MILCHTRSRQTSSALRMALLLMLLTACSAAAPRASPGASATALPSAVGPPLGSTLAPPSAPPVGELPGSPLTLTRGTAQVTLTGGASETFEVTLTSGVLIPGTDVILVWSGSPGDESGNDGLRIQAPSQMGVYPSAGDDFGAPQISVTTGRIGTAGVPPQFAPIGDECTLTLTKVDAAGVAGSLECHGLTSTGYDQPVDVQARFTATP